MAIFADRSERARREYEQEQAQRRMCGLLHDIRAEAQNLKNLLLEIERNAGLSDPRVRAREVGLALRQSQNIFAPNRRQVEELIRKLREHEEGHPEVHDRYGDEVTHVENLWERVCSDWPREESLFYESLRRAARRGRPSPDPVLHQAGKAKGWLDELIYRSGLATTPGRLNQELRQLSVGQTLDFHEAFRDELPEEGHRLAVLRYMRAHPLSIEGVVDVERGLIYRAKPSALRRWAAFLGLLLLVLVGLVVATFAGAFAPSRNDEDTLVLGTIYVFLFVGAFVHAMVALLKESRAGEGSSFSAIIDWLVWVHIREGAMFKRILYLWAVLAGLAYFYWPDLTAVSSGVAFLIGYSVDSFVDLFLRRVDQTVSVRFDALRKVVEGK